MQEFEFQISEGSLYYVRQGQGVEVTRYQGLAARVVIPEELPVTMAVLNGTASGGDVNWGDGNALNEKSVCLPVTSLAKKVFLSKKYLRGVTLPGTLKSVGDWAFAYCDALREVRFGSRDVSFGKDVFKECASLRCVRFPLYEMTETSGKCDGQCVESVGEGTAQHVESSGECNGRHAENSDADMDKNGRCTGIGSLMAAAVTQMNAAYLLDGREAGTKEWLSKWDARMLAILHAQDDEGYSKQILCGEEDYESADLETYLRNSRKKKIRLLFLRLIYPLGLEPDKVRELTAYLLAHTKGCATEETWQVIRDEYGDRREFYELFANIGCLTKENAPSVIAETGEEYPEMKAFFLKYQADHFSGGDFFGGLEL